MKIKGVLGLAAIAVFAIAMIVLRPVPRASAAAAPPERHPQIRMALRALNNAREHLTHGAHDFGGHRAKALELTNSAIEQCRIALQYDRH